MKTTKILSAMIVLALTAGSLTACKGSKNGKDDGTLTNTSYLYQYTAVCEGAELCIGHANKIILTDATGQEPVVAYTDFWIDLEGDGIGDFRVKSALNATSRWSGTPAVGKVTTLTNVGAWLGTSCMPITGAQIKWNTMDTNDADKKAEGKATFSYKC